MSNLNKPTTPQPKPTEALQEQPKKVRPPRSPEEQARLDQFHKDLAKGFVEALNKGALAE